MSSLIIIAPTESSEQPRVLALTESLRLLRHPCSVLHTLSLTYTHAHTYKHSCFTYEELKLINYLDPVTQSLEAFFNVFLIVCLFAIHVFVIEFFFLLFKIFEENVGNKTNPFVISLIVLRRAKLV
jgi:hypothetical protein